MQKCEEIREETHVNKKDFWERKQVHVSKCPLLTTVPRISLLGAGVNLRELICIISGANEPPQRPYEEEKCTSPDNDIIATLPETNSFHLKMDG